MAVSKQKKQSFDISINRPGVVVRYAYISYADTIEMRNTTRIRKTYRLGGGGGGSKNEGNFDEEYWRKATNHEPNDLKFQTKKTKKNKQ